MAFTRTSKGCSIVSCLLLLTTLAVPCFGNQGGNTPPPPLPSHHQQHHQGRRLLLASKSEAPLDYTDYRFGTLRFESVQSSDGSANISHHVPHMLDALVTVHLDTVALAKGDSLTEEWKLIEGQSLTVYLHQHSDDLFEKRVYHETLRSVMNQLSGLHFCPLEGDRVLAIDATIEAVQPLSRSDDVSFLVGAKIHVIVAHHLTKDAEGAYAALALANNAAANR